MSHRTVISCLTGFLVHHYTITDTHTHTEIFSISARWFLYNLSPVAFHPFCLHLNQREIEVFTAAPKPLNDRTPCYSFFILLTPLPAHTTFSLIHFPAAKLIFVLFLEHVEYPFFNAIVHPAFTNWNVLPLDSCVVLSLPFKCWRSCQSKP